MGKWETENGNSYNVNLEIDLIKAMKKEGGRFCWMSDTPGIKNENNEMFYKTETVGNEDEQDKQGETEERVIREGITVKAENGDPVTGYIVHWVLNDRYKTAGTDIKEWFIIMPDKYPTRYIIEKTSGKIVITDL